MEEAAQILEIETFIPLLLQVPLSLVLLFIVYFLLVKQFSHSDLLAVNV